MTTIKDIQHMTAQVCEVTVKDIKGPSRHHAVTIPRMVAYHVCNQLTDKSLVVIGRAFGNRCHSTIGNGIKRVQDDPELLEMSRDIAGRLQPVVFKSVRTVDTVR